MSRELLPCPHCGGEAVESHGRKANGDDWPYIECLECASCSEPDVWNRRAHLQAAKPEQAQTAVVLPEPAFRQVGVEQGTNRRVQIANYTADQMESYATAKTAEAVALYQEQVRELVDGLRVARIHAGPSVAIAALLTKYAPKKEQTK